MLLVEMISDVLTTSKNNFIYMGIDPGASGAVAAIIGVTGRKAFVAEIPTIVVKRAKGTKSEFDYKAIAEAFRPFRYKLYKSQCERTAVLLEEGQIQMHAGKGAGNSAYIAFRVGVGFGLWPMLLACCGISYQTIHPATWKAKMQLRGKDKEAARAKAIALFPDVDLHRKKDHNKAEALLLAEYHRRTPLGD